MSMSDSIERLIRVDKEEFIRQVRWCSAFDEITEDYTHNDDIRFIEVERDEALERDEYNLILSHPLHEAICEGRKDDAIHLLREMFDQHFNDADTYARLFPGRVK